MRFTTVWVVLNLALSAAILVALVFLFVLAVKALKRYLGAKPVREEKAETARSLGV